MENGLFHGWLHQFAFKTIYDVGGFKTLQNKKPKKLTRKFLHVGNSHLHTCKFAEMTVF